MTGRVVAIFTAPAGGAPMVAHDQCTATGAGIAGDRYAAKTGTYSARAGRGREITLIAREAVVAANREGVTIGEGETRRNFVTEGVDLDALVGKTFAIGDVTLLGVRDCPPCAYLEGLTRPGVKDALEGGGGLRAEVVRDGVVRVGDDVREVSESEPRRAS
jgi:MOSC domain-containing protein YiiM